MVEYISKAVTILLVTKCQTIESGSGPATFKLLHKTVILICQPIVADQFTVNFSRDLVHTNDVSITGEFLYVSWRWVAVQVLLRAWEYCKHYEVSLVFQPYLTMLSVTTILAIGSMSQIFTYTGNWRNRQITRKPFALNLGYLTLLSINISMFLKYFFHFLIGQKYKMILFCL